MTLTTRIYPSLFVDLDNMRPLLKVGVEDAFGFGHGSSLEKDFRRGGVRLAFFTSASVPVPELVAGVGAQEGQVVHLLIHDSPVDVELVCDAV